MSADPTDDAERREAKDRQERISEIRDKEPMARLFRKSTAKMIGGLIDCPYDMSISGIASAGGVERSTVYEHIDTLIELNIVEETRIEGNSQKYDLADTEQAELVVELNRSLYSTLRDS